MKFHYRWRSLEKILPTPMPPSLFMHSYMGDDERRHACFCRMLRVTTCTDSQTETECLNARCATSQHWMFQIRFGLRPIQISMFQSNTNFFTELSQVILFRMFGLTHCNWNLITSNIGQWRVVEAWTSSTGSKNLLNNPEMRPRPKTFLLKSDARLHL